MWWRRNWIWLWLALCALLILCAPLKRQLDCRLLARQLGARLEQARQKDSLLDAYLWGDWSSGSSDAVQGPAIWLLRQGFRDPGLERGLLLAESQRLYDHVYLYPLARNADLRAWLLWRYSEGHLPPDLDLEYAAGRLALALGRADAALPYLQRAAQALPRWELPGYASGGKVPDARHVLGRLGAALTLCDRDSEAGELLRAGHERRSRDSDYAWAYAHWLADQGRWEELLPLCTSFRERDPRGDWAWLERNVWLNKGQPDYYLASLDRDIAALEEQALNAADQWSAENLQFQAAALKHAAAELQAALESGGSSDPDSLWRLYLLGGGAAALAALDALKSSLDGAWPGPEADWQVRDDWQRRRFACGMWLAMGLIREGRWNEAQAELARIGPEMFWDESADRDWQEQELLCRIALGQSLDKPFKLRRGVDNREQWDPAWGAPAQDPSAEESWGGTGGAEYGSAGLQSAGRFSALRSGDRLTALLRSPALQAALEHSGQSLEALLPGLEAACRPGLEAYYDWSNGPLPEGWMQTTKIAAGPSAAASP
ncbi:hypothetical protein IT575_12720 [bacterium]|nr:hypothetical protein [bacterium]